MFSFFAKDTLSQSLEAAKANNQYYFNTDSIIKAIVAVAAYSLIIPTVIHLIVKYKDGVSSYLTLVDIFTYSLVIWIIATVSAKFLRTYTCVSVSYVEFLT